MANQNAAVDLGTLHQAIIDQIAAQFPVFAEVGDYPQDRKPKAVPAFWLDLEEIEPAGDEDPGTGQQALSLRFAGRIVLPFRTPLLGRQVRILACAVAAFAHLNRWGQPVNAAEVVGAYPDAFNPELDQYEVWRIEWQQVGHFGTSVWLDWTPDTAASGAPSPVMPVAAQPQPGSPVGDNTAATGTPTTPDLPRPPDNVVALISQAPDIGPGHENDYQPLD